MGTAISQANFETALGECYDAIAASTGGTAWTWYARAEAQHAGLATSSATGALSVGRRDRLEGLRVALEAAEQAAARYASKGRFCRLGTRHR